VSGFAYANLTNWEKLFDEQLNWLGDTDLRGKANLLPSAVLEEVVSFARKSREEASAREGDAPAFAISKFYLELREAWPTDRLGPCPCRQTVTEILQGTGLYGPEPRKKRPEQPPAVKGYYPNAQVAVDGHEVPVEIGGVRHRFNVEFCRSVETGKVTAQAVTDEETGAAVLAVLEQHLVEHGPPRKVLSDSRSANLDHRVEALLERHDIQHELVSDWHSNGGIEGEFGYFSKVVGQSLRIEGETPKDWARSALDHLVRVYALLRPAPARCRHDPAAQPKSPEEQARLDRQMQQDDERRKRPRAQPPRSPEKQNEIEYATQHLGLSVEDPAWFQRNLAIYDSPALQQAREAYVIYSQREAFSPEKATAPYFLAIVRAKQHAIDKARAEARAAKKYALDARNEQQRQEHQLQLEARRAEHQLHTDPISYILRKLENLWLAPQFIRERMHSLHEEIRQAIVRLANSARANDSVRKLYENVYRTFGQAAQEVHSFLKSLAPDICV